MLKEYILVFNTNAFSAACILGRRAEMLHQRAPVPLRAAQVAVVHFACHRMLYNITCLVDASVASRRAVSLRGERKCGSKGCQGFGIRFWLV